MKKILFTIAVIMALTINVSAQYKPFQFGLKVEPGAAWSKLDSDDLYDGKTTMSFNWGFTGNFYFVENYGLSTGFNVRYINGGYSFCDSIREYDRTIKNQYVEIPISLMMRTEAINDIRIFGNIGYGLGICLDHEAKTFDAFDNEIDIDTDRFNKIRHAFILKLGIEYNVYKSSCLTAAVVYNNNFVNIYDRNASHDVLINNLCLEIGFLF